jgi:hypothetical protein
MQSVVNIPDPDHTIMRIRRFKRKRKDHKRSLKKNLEAERKINTENRT